MPTERMIQLTFRVIVALRWVWMSLFYYYLITEYKLFGLLTIAIFLGLAATAYLRDKDREAQGMDDFQGTGLFFRYGELVNEIYFPVQVKPEWGPDEVSSFATRFREELAAAIAACLPSESVQVIANRSIVDQETQEKKVFLRLMVKSRFGSMLTHFVHYAPFGKTVTGHYFTYLRGPQSDWALVKFLFFSPFTIWLWGIPWLQNRYSILAAISVVRESSFDSIDIRTIYALTHRVLYEQTEKLLDNYGLLTEAIKQMINVHMNNTQTFNISNSKDVKFSNLSQSTGSPARSPLGARA